MAAVDEARGTHAVASALGCCLALCGRITSLASRAKEMAFRLRLKPLPFVVGPECADFSPDGVVPLAFHHEQLMARAVGLAVFGYGGSPVGFSGCAFRIRSGDVGDRLAGADCKEAPAEGPRTRGEGRRLDALRADRTGASSRQPGRNGQPDQRAGGSAATSTQCLTSFGSLGARAKTIWPIGGVRPIHGTGERRERRHVRQGCGGFMASGLQPNWSRRGWSGFQMRQSSGLAVPAMPNRATVRVRGGFGSAAVNVNKKRSSGFRSKR
jgi:hypothetical protein